MTEVAVTDTTPPTGDLAPAAPPPPAPAPDPVVEPAAPRRRLAGLRRPALVAGLLRVLRLVVGVGLLVAGIAVGATLYQSTVVAPAAPPAGDPAVDGVEAPSVVHELAGALAANDSDRIRAAVPGEPYELLTNEMGNWSFDDVESVVVLGTFRDDTRTATALIVRGRNSDGSPILINLIVHTEDGVVVNIR